MGFLADTFTDRVKISVDSAATGALTDGRMGVQPVLRPVPGLHAVQCKVVFVKGRTYLAYDKPNALGAYKIQFLAAVDLNPTHWVEWYDNGMGKLRLLNVDGVSWADPSPPTSAIERTWGCNAIEYAL